MGAFPEKFIKYDDPKFRAAVAKNGQYLNILQDDESPEVLYNVIRQGYNLEHFVKHPSDEVREDLIHYVYMSKDTDLKHQIYSQLKDDRSDKIRNYIAKDGYYLDQYVNDESAYVREAVAKNRYGLDQLIHDTDEYVLTNVAEHGYGLDELKTHPSPFIRGMVASKGYQPELFIHDPSKMVRQIAQPILMELEWERDHTLTLDDLSSLTQDSNIKSKGF